MPRSKTGVKRTPVCKEDLERAVHAVIKKDKTAYGAAKEFKVDKATLLRHVNKFKASGLSNFEYKHNNDTNKVFNDDEETLLVQYILKASHLNHGLTLKNVRTLAYQLAKKIGKKYNSSWDTNKIAGKEWLRNFRRRHKILLSLRKPEATSLARTKAFNEANVALVLDNFKKDACECKKDPMNDVESQSMLVPRNEHPEKNLGAPISSNRQSDFTVRLSTSNKQTNPSHSLRRRQVFSLEDIRSYPNALPRKQINSGRAKGKSTILTDTPKTNRIEAQKLAKSSKGTRKVANSTNPKIIRKKLTYQRSSESDVDEPQKLCEDEDLSGEVFANLEDPNSADIAVGCFILVKLRSKKTVKFFAAEVVSISEDTCEVKYLKKDVNSQTFTREDPETYELDKSDVLFKLPHPVLSGGSKRQLQKLTFGVDLSNLNVE